LYLEGTGERSGLRCMSLKGSVLEGRDDPCCVGAFDMTLVLPTSQDVAALEERHQARVDARPAPPLSFRLDGFVGRWRLLLSLDDEDSPAIFAISLDGNRSFTSETSANEQVLAGSWGLYTKGYRSRPDGGASGSSIQPIGSSLWLKINRDKSSETFKGIADLPVRENFHLWGKPKLESFEAELAARTEAGGTSDRVDGVLWVGAVERAYFGRFSLLRETEGDDEMRA